MNETLLDALNHLLVQIDEPVEDLLLVELDWGDRAPTPAGEMVPIQFQGATWQLVFAGSELVLRRALCRAGIDGRVIVLLSDQVPFSVPADVRARAWKGTIYRLGLRYWLYAQTQRDWPVEVDYAEWRPTVEGCLDALATSAAQAGLVTWHMTRDDLERALVRAAFGLDVRERRAALLLGDLVAAQRKGSGPPSDLVLSLLKGHLRQHGTAWGEIVAWAAGEPGRAEETIKIGLMMGAEHEARRMPNWGSLNRLRALLVNERQMAESDAMAAVVKLAGEALPHLHHATREQLVKAAEKALDGILPADSYNPWFPTALQRECERLAKALSRRDTSVVHETPRLRQHLSAAQNAATLDALEEMGRFVLQWEEQGSEAVVQALDGVAAWAEWYLERGARLDLAALKLMDYQGQGIPIAGDLGILLDRYWPWRNTLNSTFAKRFLDQYEAALHDRESGVFGVHRLLTWMVRPVLQQGGRVLWLIVDGLGCALFQQLMEHWSQASAPVYASRVQPALALLPSVTSMSRKALFLGALPTDRLDDEQTYEAKARTTETAALTQALPGYRVKLYNKSNLDRGQELLTDVQFNGADLVAVVLNAVDDEVKSTNTAVRLPSLSDLGPLPNAVRAALQAGWTVVLTADHGHTWHRSKKLRRGEVSPGGGERFKPVPGEQGGPEDMIVTQDPHIVRVQEGKKVGLLTATGAYFGNMPRRGYHGGAALEEVIVPCAVLTLHPSAAQTAAQAGAGKPSLSEPASSSEYDLSAVDLVLPDGKRASLQLPIDLQPFEVRLLQTLAGQGEASESELKQRLQTRRVAGPLAALRERLAQAGPAYDFIEETGTGAGGTTYRFRHELLN